MFLDEEIVSYVEINHKTTFIEDMIQHIIELCFEKLEQDLPTYGEGIDRVNLVKKVNNMVNSAMETLEKKGLNIIVKDGFKIAFLYKNPHYSKFL